MFQNIPATMLLTMTPDHEAVNQDAPSAALARGFARAGKAVGRVIARGGRVTAEFENPTLQHTLAA